MQCAEEGAWAAMWPARVVIKVLRLVREAGSQ
jgi:hypothetical protein